jgi:hypothetical protein
MEIHGETVDCGGFAWPVGDRFPIGKAIGGERSRRRRDERERGGESHGGGDRDVSSLI